MDELHEVREMQEMYKPEDIEASKKYSSAIKKMNSGKINMKKNIHEQIEIGIVCGMTISQIQDVLNDISREFFYVSELIKN